MKQIIFLALLTLGNALAQFPYQVDLVSPTAATQTIDLQHGNTFVELQEVITISLPATTPATNRNFTISSPLFSTGYIDFSIESPGFTQFHFQALIQSGTTAVVHLKANPQKFGVGNFSVPIKILDYQGESRSIDYQLRVIDSRPYSVPPASARVIPHYASGQGWSTSVQLTNQTSYNSYLKIEFFDVAGTPVSRKLRDGRNQQLVYIDVFPHGTKSIALEDQEASTILTGSIQVTPISGSAIGVNTTFETSSPSRAAATPGQEVADGNLTFYFDNSGKNLTGLALRNSLNYGQEVQLNFYDSYGNFVLAQSIYIPSNGQSAMALNSRELAGMVGTVTVAAPRKAVNGIALRFDKDFYFVPISPFVQ
jgi:hypothetical protein